MLPREDMDPAERIWFEIHDKYGCRATHLARRTVEGAMRMVDQAVDSSDVEVGETAKMILTIDAVKFVADECRREGELGIAAAILTFLKKATEHVLTSVDDEHAAGL